MAENDTTTPDAPPPAPDPAPPERQNPQDVQGEDQEDTQTQKDHVTALDYRKAIAEKESDPAKIKRGKDYDPWAVNVLEESDPDLAGQPTLQPEQGPWERPDYPGVDPIYIRPDLPQLDGSEGPGAIEPKEGVPVSSTTAGASQHVPPPPNYPEELLPEEHRKSKRGSSKKS